jgi:hypothetical protein
MTEICRVLQTSLEIHVRADMDQLSAALFGALDTDEVRHTLLETRRRSFSCICHLQNGLVDALEFLGTVAVMSAMTVAQKLTCTCPDTLRCLEVCSNLTCCLPDSRIQLLRLQRDGQRVDRRANAGALPTRRPR